jgi:hypothetical protein
MTELPVGTTIIIGSNATTKNVSISTRIKPSTLHLILICVQGQRSIRSMKEAYYSCRYIKRVVQSVPYEWQSGFVDAKRVYHLEIVGANKCKLCDDHH